MNIKVTVKTPLGDTRYCVLSAEEDFKKQMEAVLDVKSGQGFSVEVSETAVKLTDYFSGETRATFEILSLEDCELEAALYWTKI